ncbi:MAG TPA: fumarylacetoacetate hydrolase family protein [Jatrophihabitans sp.]|jgi:2-keto-4-pentenoate hydratase/2-oxohepta-3-ene-1,7-dioic acid hydratase in catechol pathway|nr:fumarylacetoacetate hydrolase family protein [Jatrophihabitans sp.]
MSSTTPYALGRFRTVRGGEFCGVVIGDDTAPLIELHPDTVDVADLLTDWPVHAKILDEAVTDAVTTGRWDELARPIGELSVLAPLAPPQVFQSGANYRTHVIQLIVAAAEEAGEQDRDGVLARATALMQERAEHGTPYVFLGLPSTIVGPYDDVVLPPIGAKHDWELELAAVIGRDAYQVSRADALDHVAGYVMVNDLTTRDRVFRPDMPSLGTDWLAGKNSPTFLPLGPWFVPAQFVDDPMDLRITLSLNGEVMQDETTADMIFGVAQLVEHVSSITPMRPGDLLLTGSPAGNGAHYGRYLRPGDVMESSITGLGVQRNRCVTR